MITTASTLAEGLLCLIYLIPSLFLPELSEHVSSELNNIGHWYQEILGVRLKEKFLCLTKIMAHPTTLTKMFLCRFDKEINKIGSCDISDSLQKWPTPSNRSLQHYLIALAK